MVVIHEFCVPLTCLLSGLLPEAATGVHVMWLPNCMYKVSACDTIKLLIVTYTVDDNGGGDRSGGED